MTGSMHVLPSAEGDITVTWDTDEADTIAFAESQFATFTGQGYRAAKMVGGVGEQIDSFDPEAEQIVLFRALQGG